MIGTAFEVSSLCVAAADGSGQRIPILDDVSLHVPVGSVVAVVGESGAGKSTLLSAALGVLPLGIEVGAGMVQARAPGSGQTIRWRAGRRIPRSASIGYVPQDCMGGLDPLMKVGSALEACLRARPWDRRSSPREHIHRALVRAGIDDAVAHEIIGRRPGELSGGQRQRVMVAMARLHAPAVVLYDEPTSALDEASKGRVLGAIGASCAEGAAALVVTHDLLALEGFADTVYVLYRGRVVEHGPAEAVLGDPGHPYTRDLVASIPRPGQVGLPPVPRAAAWASSGATDDCESRERCDGVGYRCATERPGLADQLERRGTCHGE